MTSTDGITEAMADAFGNHFFSHWDSIHQIYKERVRTGIAAALAAQKGEGVLEGWQLIATAPKDGRELLLRVKMRAGIPDGHLVGHYMHGGHCIEDHPAIEAGWYFWNSCMFDKAAEPTHWKPLDAASPSPASWNEADKLRSALEPFTKLGGPNDGVMPAYHDLPDDVVVYENSGQCITAGDVRAARNAFGILHAPWPIQPIFTAEQHEPAAWNEAEIEAIADAIDESRYQHPDHPTTKRPRPFSEAGRSDREYAIRLARAVYHRALTRPDPAPEDKK